jgi:alpha-L-rhamnosidase
MYRVVAGINIDEDTPGYKKVIIKPHPTDSLTFASASLQTYYGKVSSECKKENGNFILNVDVPANTTATIYVPAADVESITENGKKMNDQKELKAGEIKNGYVVVRTGSGKYSFIVNLKKEM